MAENFRELPFHALGRIGLAAGTIGPVGRDEGRDGYEGNNGAHGGIVVVKNKQEWLESRKKLKERKKKRGAKEGRASDEPAAFGFPLGRIEEQIERLPSGSGGRRRRGGAGDR